MADTQDVKRRTEITRHTVWVCKDGRHVLISHMEDRHLHNCINMILRHKNWRRHYLDQLMLEANRRARPPELEEQGKLLHDESVRAIAGPAVPERPDAPADGR